jgi:type I restriction enzyme M protein
VVKKGEKLNETPDFVIGKKKYKVDLIPPQIIISNYFKAGQDEVDRLQGELDAISQELESFIEEHSGEDGALEDAKNDKEKVTKASVTEQKRKVKASAGGRNDLKVLDDCLSLFSQETGAKKAVKDAQDALDAKVFAHYPKLTKDEVQALIVDQKWMGYLEATIRAEIERVTQVLANRVKTLEERYAEPLPQLVGDVDALAGKVDMHLKKMGLSW